MPGHLVFSARVSTFLQRRAPARSRTAPARGAAGRIRSPTVKPSEGPLPSTRPQTAPKARGSRPGIFGRRLRRRPRRLEHVVGSSVASSPPSTRGARPPPLLGFSPLQPPVGSRRAPRAARPARARPALARAAPRRIAFDPASASRRRRGASPPDAGGGRRVAVAGAAARGRRRAESRIASDGRVHRGTARHSPKPPATCAPIRETSVRRRSTSSTEAAVLCGRWRRFEPRERESSSGRTVGSASDGRARNRNGFCERDSLAVTMISSSGSTTPG